MAVGLLVPLNAKSDKITATAEFLDKGAVLVRNEPLTSQWFALKYTKPEETYAIFDTFESNEGRNAHLGGPIAEALLAHAPTLLSSPPDIGHVDVLASRVDPLNSDEKNAGVSVGLRVLFTAKEDKIQQVRDFLIGALPLVNDEPSTVVWYAIHFPGTANFGIVDFFPDEEGRKAHLNGKVAAALFASVDELLTGTPDVIPVDVLAAKITV